MNESPHECDFSLYSHTSYQGGECADVLRCSRPDCPKWTYGEWRALEPGLDVPPRHASHPESACARWA